MSLKEVKIRRGKPLDEETAKAEIARLGLGKFGISAFAFRVYDIARRCEYLNNEYFEDLLNGPDGERFRDNTTSEKRERFIANYKIFREAIKKDEKSKKT
jgi:hypothetical protein